MNGSTLHPAGPPGLGVILFFQQMTFILFTLKKDLLFTAQGLCWCPGAFSSCGEQGLLSKCAVFLLQ